MESKTFSIDHDLYYASQHCEEDSLVEQMYREIDALAHVPGFHSETKFAIKSLARVAGEISQHYSNHRIAERTAVGLLRSLWSEAVQTLQRNGYELEMPDDS